MGHSPGSAIATACAHRVAGGGYAPFVDGVANGPKLPLATDCLAAVQLSHSGHCHV